MAISKYTLYKYVKVDGTWRYCKAAYHENGKIKPDIVFVNVKQGLLEKHPEGRYYISHNGQWIDVGTDALEAQPKRKQRLAVDEYNRLSGATFVKNTGAPLVAGRITLVAAAEKYFANCEARGLDAKTIRKYRAAVDPFIQHCGVTYVDECRDNKQVLLDYMSWFENLWDARRKIAAWKEEYNGRRPHSSLGYQTPAAYARQFAASVGSVPLRGTTPPDAVPQKMDSQNAIFV